MVLCKALGAIAEYPAHQMSYLKKLPTRSAVLESMNEKKSVKGQAVKWTASPVVVEWKGKH